MNSETFYEVLKITCISYFSLNILTVLWFLMTEEFLIKKYRQVTTEYIEPRIENSHKTTSTFFEQYYDLNSRMKWYLVFNLLLSGIIICWSLINKVKPKTETSCKTHKVNSYFMTGKFIKTSTGMDEIQQLTVIQTTEYNLKIIGNHDKFTENYNQSMKAVRY